MCASCAVNGAEQQCPTCRQLNPVGFPWDATADVSALWSHATDGFQRELVMCIVAVLIYLAITIAGAFVANVIVKIVETILGLEIDAANPLSNLRYFAVNIGISQVVGQIVNLVTQGVALVGIYRVFMDVLVGKKADIARMFSQLELLPKYVVMHLILFVTVSLPTFIYFGIVGAMSLRLVNVDWDHLSSFRFEKLLKPEFIGLLFGSSVVYLVAMFVVLPVLFFSTPELMIGQCTPVEAIRRAWGLGDGQRLRLFGYSFIAFVLYLAGAMCCGIGVIFTLPVAAMLMLSLFLALRQSSQLPAPNHA